jgi:hypothetical protein
VKIRERVGGLVVSVDLDGAPVTIEPRRLDITMVPGARVTAAVAWQAGRTRLDVVCAQARVPLWVPGLERAVLDGASARVQAELALPNLVARTAIQVGVRHEQPFDADGPEVAVRGRHVFAFVTPRDAMSCTAVCISALASDCDAATQSLRIDGEFVAPAVSGFARMLPVVAQRPWLAASACLGAALMVVASLLVFRPRPRRF